MKPKFTLAIVSIFMFISSLSYASFPVERTVVTTLNTTNAITETTTVLSSPAAVDWSDRQTIAFVLWLIPLTGFLAIHRFYLGSPLLWNVIFILTGGFFLVGWILDGIDIITGAYPGL